MLYCMVKASHIEIVGNRLAVVFTDGRRFFGVPVRANRWILSDSLGTDDVTPDPGPPGDPGGGTPADPSAWRWPFQYSRYVLDDPLAQYGMRINPVTGQYKMHNGLDFGGGGIGGQDIPVAAAGTVTVNGPLDARGNHLSVDHGGGLSTNYFHMASPSPHAVGTKLTAGQIIGQVGSTGNSTGAHLHWETLTNGDFNNPRDFMKARGVPES